MSLITIIAKSSVPVSWRQLFDEIGKMNLNTIELFPIPKELNFETDALGIAVQNNYVDKKDVAEQLNKLCEFLIGKGFELNELYNGAQINKQNIEQAILTFLP